jgi:hypothetical protein
MACPCALFQIATRRDSFFSDRERGDKEPHELFEDLVSGARERTCKPTHERFLFVESYGIDVDEGWRWCEGGIYTSFWA